MARTKAPALGSQWRRVKGGHRYHVTAIYHGRDDWTVELVPEPGESARKTWLGPTGFAAKFEPTPLHQ